MGKNKSGGLIEDRVIRNPMEQMRRKLKFKEKEKRKEVREFNREQMMNKPVVDPLLNHDFSAINQIKMQEAQKYLGAPQKPQNFTGTKSGVMSSLVPQESNRGQIYYYD